MLTGHPILFFRQFISILRFKEIRLSDLDEKKGLLISFLLSFHNPQQLPNL